MFVLAYVLIVLGTLFSVINWSTLLASVVRKRFVSAVPLIGAVPLGCGLALLPNTRSIAPLALVADYGTLILIIALPRIAYDVWSTSANNILHGFSSTTVDRAITVKLYRNHNAVVSVQFTSPVACSATDARVGRLSLTGSWSEAEGEFLINGYGSGRHLRISKKDLAYLTIETNYPSDNNNKNDCLDGLVMQKQN